LAFGIATVYNLKPVEALALFLNGRVKQNFIHFINLQKNLQIRKKEID
jgi:hypothetical protein